MDFFGFFWIFLVFLDFLDFFWIFLIFNIFFDFLDFLESYIRKGKYRPATTTTTPAPPVSRSGYPPWILKRGGLESSG